MSWIKITDEMPGEYLNVLVFCSTDKYSPYSIAQWLRGLKLWYDQGSEVIENVTHWQRLPAPPEVPE